MHVLHKLKHDFLILGFSGPLRSGCTTSAKFLSKNLKTSIKNLISSNLILQNEIEDAYKKLSDNSPYLEYDRKEKIHHKLKIDLKKREALKVLKDSEHDDFLYLSMTNMLIKSLVESLDEAVDRNGLIKKNKKKYRTIEDIHNLLVKKYPDLDKLKAINQAIIERDFSGLTEKDFKEYETYVFKRIPASRREILKLIGDNELVGSLLQDFGDNLRKCGNPFIFADNEKYSNPENVFALSEQANNIIKFFRSRDREKICKTQRVKHFVIEAFRNPYEVEYFRNRYYEFFLFSLYSDIGDRQNRGNFSLNRDGRDQGEGYGIENYFKQNVSECVRISDIAINNEETINKLHEKIMFYLALVIQPGCYSPDWAETAMHMAYSMSVRSSCISRQVGAVIEGPDGYIVGAGWNDVGNGQIGCGYRHYGDIENISSDAIITNPEGEEDFRRWLTQYGGKNGHLFCFKDKYSEYKMRKKLKYIEKEVPEGLETPDRDAKKYLAQTLQKQIKMQQYCRALHAEENAILQTAIIGGIGIKGGAIYTTTFPCELCAKKIYQSGLSKVFYTEPYPHSISQDVFFKDGIKEIEFIQFEGVKSQSYFRLYKATIDKKEYQILEAL